MGVETRGGDKAALLPPESVLAIPDRLASTPEPLHRIWLRRPLQSSAAATAPHTRHISPFSATTDWRVLCAYVGHSAPLRRRCEAVAHTTSAQRRLDADTTSSVDIGAHSGDDRT